MLLEKEHDIFKLEVKFINVNPLVFIGKFILGIIFCIISFIWWLHILLFNVAKKDGYPVSSFLNKIFIGLENAGVGFLATGFFSFFSLYLLFCTQKGNLKMGVRIPFLFTLHPMKINETFMNSFLFNVLLILMSSVAIVQFCS